MVWRQYFSTCDGQCYICGYKITTCTFEAGHIIAEALGGKTALGNLRPICKTCNNCMGTRHMDEYKREQDEFRNGLNIDMKRIEQNIRLTDDF